MPANEQFEHSLASSLFSKESEKTSIDKVLARKDIEDVRALIKQSRLKREQLLELLYLISGSEAKLLNYSAWDRYVILKFFVWIREFVKIAEIMYDYTDMLEQKELDGIMVLSGRAKKTLDNNQRLIEHNAKFLIDLYLNIGRTSLSVGATGFFELLKNKYELVYPQASNNQSQPENSGLFGMFKGGGKK